MPVVCGSGDPVFFGEISEIDENATGVLVPSNMKTGSWYSGDQIQTLAITEEFPAVFDWRKLNGVTPVKDQGNCGACFAFPVVALVESAVLLDTGKITDLSEEQAKDCAWESMYEMFGGCSGGTTIGVINTFTQKGVVTEAADPYFPINCKCDEDTIPVYRVTGWDMVTGEDVPHNDILKDIIMNVGPVAVSVIVDGWDKPYDGSTILSDPGKDEHKNHSILLVGWNDSTGNASIPGHWIFKNSWGDNSTGDGKWGDNGYGYIEYKEDGVGKWGSIVINYEVYDPQVRTVFHDEAGMNGAIGCVGESELQGMVFYDVAWERVTNIEFWTSGKADVSFKLYDSVEFAEERKSIKSIEEWGNLLYETDVHRYDYPGYHSIKVTSDESVISSTGTYVLVGTIKNYNGIFKGYDGYDAVIPFDHKGEILRFSYVAISDENSPNYNGKWYPASSLSIVDDKKLNSEIAFRLRVSTDVNPPPECSEINISALGEVKGIQVNSSVRFQAFCYDQYDEEINCGNMDWFSENETVGIMDGTIFRALSVGSTDVIADGCVQSNVINVTVVMADSKCDYMLLGTKEDTDNIQTGDSFPFILTCYDQYGDVISRGPGCEWYISNESVGTVKEGIFYAMSPGYTIVTVSDGLCNSTTSNSISITVKGHAVPKIITEKMVLERFDNLSMQLDELSEQRTGELKKIELFLKQSNSSGTINSYEAIYDQMNKLQMKIDEIKEEEQGIFDNIWTHLTKLF
ncbi:MAG: C1 family peptidase [Methanosarcinaceae archaeon]